MLALSIQTVNGDWEFLEFQPDVRMNVVTVNPAFDQSVVGRAFSYPFTLPRTSANLSKLRHFSRLDARYRENEFPARVYLDGGLFQVGALTVTEITEDIEVTFSNQERRLVDYFSKLKIRELMETVDVPQTIEPQWTWVLAGGGPISIFKLQINDEDYAVATTSEDVAGPALVDLINDVYPGVASYEPAGNFLYLNPGWDYDPFIVRSCPNWGMQIGSFTNLAEARMENFLAWVSGLRETPPDWGAFPLVLWDDFYRFDSGESADRIGLNGNSVNSIVGTPGIGYPAKGNDEWPQQKRWARTYVPFVRMKYVLDQIMGAVDQLTGWVGEIYEQDDTAALLVFNNFSLDAVRQDYWPDNDFDALVDDKYLNCFRSKVVLSQHVPSITGLAAIERFCLVRNLYIVTDGGTSVQFKRRLDQIIDVPRDWRPFLQKERRVLVKPREGVGLKYEDEPLEEYMDATQLQPFGEDGGIQTEITGTLFDKLYTSLGVTFRNCATDMPGQSDEWKEGGGEDALMRFLFDRGVVDPDGDDTNRYWRSSHTDLAPDGVTQVGDYTLEISGDSGLYNRFWRRWLELQDRPTADLYFVLPAAEIIRMSKWTNARVKIYDPQGDVTLVVKSLEFEVTLTAIGVVKAEVVIQ